MYWYVSFPYKAIYQLLITKRKCLGFRHYNGSKSLIDHSIDVDNIYGIIEEYNSNKKCKILILYDDIFADMPSNKNLQEVILF